MAGRPMQNRVVAALTKRAQHALGEDATALDYAADYVAGGKTIADLAAELSAEWNEPVSRQLVSQSIHALAPDATHRIDTARREAALVFAEDTTKIADDAEPTAGGAAKARLQIGARQWLAERFDAARFGAKSPSVQINVGSMLVAALRQPLDALSAPSAIPLEASATLLLEGSNIQEM